ncbi:SDR family oxidoreductase [Rhodococcus aerolatus]
MTTYAVTGSTGPLGHRVVESLLERGVDPSDVVALARDTTRATDLADRGVTVREADYDRPDTLGPALAGVDTLLLVSGNAVGQRVPQHRAVVDAAVAAGVRRIAYTSVLRATTTELALAPEHRATEELLAGSGLAVTLLRNGWYTENYLSQLPGVLATGALTTSAGGTARVAAAARDDYAEAAAAVLVGEGHEGATYELGGTPFTMAELAEAFAAATGTNVAHHGVSAEEHLAALRGAGLDEGTAQFVVGLDTATARGDLDTPSDHLTRLLGRPTTPLLDVVRAGVSAPRED